MSNDIKERFLKSTINHEMFQEYNKKIIEKIIDDWKYLDFLIKWVRKLIEELKEKHITESKIENIKIIFNYEWYWDILLSLLTLFKYKEDWMKYYIQDTESVRYDDESWDELIDRHLWRYRVFLIKIHNRYDTSYLKNVSAFSDRKEYIVKNLFNFSVLLRFFRKKKKIENEKTERYLEQFK